jgi:hypothetical protein
MGRRDKRLTGANSFCWWMTGSPFRFSPAGERVTVSAAVRRMVDIAV